MNNPYLPKIHFNKNGKTQCGMKINKNIKKRLIKDKNKITCRLCLKGNGMKIILSEVKE